MPGNQRLYDRGPLGAIASLRDGKETRILLPRLVYLHYYTLLSQLTHLRLSGRQLLLHFHGDASDHHCPGLSADTPLCGRPMEST